MGYRSIWRRLLVRFMAKPRLRKQTGTKYELIGGPWDGYTLYILTPPTMVFRVGNHIGRYVNAEPCCPCLYWRPER